MHTEPELLAECSEYLDVPRGLLPEREVVADHDLLRVQALHQHFVREVLRGLGSEDGGERHDAEDVYAQLFGELGTPGEGGQLGRVTSRAHHLGWMGIKSHQHRRHTAFFGGLGRGRDQLRVTSVHAVEDADRDHTSAPVRGDILKPSPAQHGTSLRPRPRDRDTELPMAI